LLASDSGNAGDRRDKYQQEVRPEPAGNWRTPPEVAVREGVPAEGRVLCFAARDEADEIAAGRFAQLIEERAVSTVSFPARTVVQNVLDVVQPSEADILHLRDSAPLSASLGTSNAIAGSTCER
jgi:hypothetical protein